MTTGSANSQVLAAAQQLPYPFKSGDELMKVCADSGMSIAQVMLENEKTWRPEWEIRDKLRNIWSVMQACVERGCHSLDPMPGPLKVRRRASRFVQTLEQAWRTRAGRPLVCP